MTLQQLSLDFGAYTQRRGVAASRGRSACVYCNATATSRDHVPPRFLLEKPLPRDLLTVPSCRDCNRSFSLDEQYLQVVIAKIGHVPQLMAKVEKGGVVDRALGRAPGLDQRIVESLDVRSDGRVWLMPERERILRIVQKIAYGLFICRYGMGASFGAFSALAVYGPEEEIPQPVVAASHYWPGIRRKRWISVQKDVFSYLFAKGWLSHDPPLYCLVGLHRTLLGVVACPDPRSKA